MRGFSRLVWLVDEIRVGQVALRGLVNKLVLFRRKNEAGLRKAIVVRYDFYSLCKMEWMNWWKYGVECVSGSYRVPWRHWNEHSVSVMLYCRAQKVCVSSRWCCAYDQSRPLDTHCAAGLGGSSDSYPWL